MIKTFIILIFQFILIPLSNCQSSYQYFFFGGPSITNVHNFWYGERLFLISPPRPYYELNFHGGMGVQRALNKKLDLRLCLGFERKGAAQTGFNKENDSFADFVILPASVFYRPTRSEMVKLELGLSSNMLIHEKNLFGEAFRTFEFASVLGVELKITKSLYFGMRWIEPFNYMKENSNLSPNPNPISLDWKQKTQSFQFSGIYQLSL